MNRYWACTVCDSGGHPLSASQAVGAADRHRDATGHLCVWGTVTSEDEREKQARAQEADRIGPDQERADLYERSERDDG